MTRGIYEVTTRDPILRQIFDTARALGIADDMLGAISGYSATSIYYYRTGRRNAPKLRTVMDWAEAVGLELAVTLTDRKQKP